MIADFIAELEGAGILLWEDEGQLRFRAPKGAMTEHRRALLSERKQAVLEFLRSAAVAVKAVSEPAARYEPFPLTEVQGAYLLGRRDVFDYGGVACHAYGELAFDTLDPPRLERAWQRLIERHDMLRAVVDANGFQRVSEAVPDYCIAVNDLRGLDAAGVAAGIQSVRVELDHKVHPADRWPLFDLRITQTDERALLHVSIDFLIADYVSISILLDELHRLYTRPEAPLPPLSISFRDYLGAERRLRSGIRYERDRKYWWDRIDQLPPAPELPTLERTAAEAPVRFRRWQTKLPPHAWAALRRQAGSNGVTASGAILAAYAEVIGRWSRQPRFTLDITVLNRLPLHLQVNSLVGDFTSISLLAVEPDAAATFSTRAQALQAQLWRDLDHRLCSGIEVIREIARRRGHAQALMPIVFTSAVGLNENHGDENGKVTNDGELVHGISQTPQVLIDCQVMERRGAVAINWDVREGVFPDGVIDDMFESFATLLGELTTDDAAWNSVSPLRLPKMQAERRAAANDTHAAVPDVLLHDGVVAQALKTPDRIAVIGGGRPVTYRELLSRAAAVAEALRAAGCGPRDIVAVVLPKSWEQVAAVLGVLHAGAAYLPIDTYQPSTRRNRLLADAGVGHVLTHSSITADASWPENIVRIAVDDLSPSTFASKPSRHGILPDDLAYVIYTSGSTGAPKGVMISHLSAVNTVHDINDRFGVGADDRILGLANLGFDLSVYDIFGPLAVGACLVLPDHQRRADASHWAELIDRHGVTLWNSVPAQLQMLSDHLGPDPSQHLSSLRLALLSGDWIPVALPVQIRQQLPFLELISLGGATEAAIWSISYPIDEVAPHWRSIPYGKPLANQTFHVLNRTLQPCPEWVTGDLYIGGIGLAKGYLGDETKTTECFIRHPGTGERLYRTGDLGRYLVDGNIEFLGREDLQVKIRGHRIELAEVEAAIEAYDGVARSAVLVDGDRALERRLVAFVMPGRNEISRPGDVQSPEAIAITADRLRRDVNDEPVIELARRLDEAALLSMLVAFRQVGLFASPQDSHSPAEILEAAEVARPHVRLVRRWLRVLEESGALVQDQATGRYRRVREADALLLDEAWREIDTLQHEFDTPHLLQYFRTSALQLPQLLRGNQDPVQLLFPEGQLEVQQAAYAGNSLTRYLNRLVGAALRLVASGRSEPGPLRVLEIGGGAGGATAQLLPVLADLEVDYTFSDVSQFLLDNARERFGEYSWVSYGIFDLNEDYRRQGFLANSFDVVVCANVLHYARNVDAAIGRIRELLKPGGTVVLLEMTRDHYQVLTSLEFLLDASSVDFEDVRRLDESTLLTRQQWQGVLRDAKADGVVCLPKPEDPLSQIGLHMFVGRFKSDRAPIDLDAMRTHLAGCLPDYMLPAHVEIVDAMPLSDNGKIDRKTLYSWLMPRTATEIVPVASEPSTELERQLAGIWAQVLGRERVGRDQNLFDLGGDSLLAARLARRIHEEVPSGVKVFFDGLLRELLEGASVASVALMLGQPVEAEHERGEDELASPLVALGGSGGEMVNVLVHDGSGGLNAYRPLIERLSGCGPLVGLAVAGTDAYLRSDPGILVENLAADYARVLRSAGHGAYHLIGYHSGGVLAVEIARHLAESDSNVESLTVISSYPLPCEVDDDLLVEYLFALGLGVDLTKIGLPPERAVGQALAAALVHCPDRIPEAWISTLDGGGAFGEVVSSFGRLAKLSHAERLAAIRDAAGNGRDQALPDLAMLHDIFRHSLKAFASHKVAPYIGDVTLLREAEVTPIWPPLREDMTAFWREICLGDLRIVDTPGNHFTCLRPPHVAQVIELFHPRRQLEHQPEQWSTR